MKKWKNHTPWIELYRSNTFIDVDIRIKIIGSINDLFTTLSQAMARMS